MIILLRTFQTFKEIYEDIRCSSCPTTPEVEFLEEIQTEVLRVFLLAIHRHLY